MRWVSALSYAYLHAEDPDKWKFNKARQNWLVRNVWSDTEVSEAVLSVLPIVSEKLTTDTDP